MAGKLAVGIDKAIYTEGETVKIKLDYEAAGTKQTTHVVVLDPSEKEVFSFDQYLNWQKGSYSTMLRFDTGNWRVPGRYKIASWDQDGARKEVFFQLKTKN